MITVQTTVKASLEKVWAFWTQPEHIMQWNNASDDWHCPKASSDLKTGGKFSYTMAAKDGSMSFDFEGTYTNVTKFSLIEYHIIDGRKVIISFEETLDGVIIKESFDPENIHPEELQQQGWQAILNNFKKYTENN
ncbi:MAG: SRPBCC family protein [Flavobacterium sp.]|nr:SRPBCC family protein [Flavobacterium sp.]